MVKGFFQVYLTDQKLSWIYSCVYCRAHLAYHEDLISKSFQGSQGRAYLFNNVVNVYFSEIKQRVFLTGIHFVADVFCAGCQAILGWKYERAFEPSQRYKEGKIIIELAHLIKDNRWDSDCAALGQRHSTYLHTAAAYRHVSGNCPKSISHPVLVRGEVRRENSSWLSCSPNRFGLSDETAAVGAGRPSCSAELNDAAGVLNQTAVDDDSTSHSNAGCQEDYNNSTVTTRRRARPVLSALDSEANIVEVAQENLNDTSPLLTNEFVATRGSSKQQFHISQWLSNAASTSKNGWRKRKRPIHRRAKSSSPSRDPLISAASDDDANLAPSEENPNRVAAYSTERLDR